MEDQEKERLKQKRLELKKRRELEGQWARLDGLFAVFESKGVSYEILYPLTIDEVASSRISDLYTQWLEAHFPMGFASIDWACVDGAQRLEVSSGAAMPGLVRELLSRNSIPDGPVVVLWWDAAMPVIAVPLSAVIDFAEEIFEQDWDTWVFDPNDNWCLENYHEGMLSFGRSGEVDRSFLKTG